MGFLDGGVSAMFASIFSGVFLDAQLYRPNEFEDDGKGGGEDGEFGTPETVKVQPEATTQTMRDRPGYVDTDKRYLMLAHEIDEPDTDCEIEAEGSRWTILNCSHDPCTAYYDLHCQHLSDLDIS